VNSTPWFLDFWARLGSRDAISWVTFVVLVILQITGPFAAGGIDFRGRETEFLVTLVEASFPVVATLALGWLLCSRLLPTAPHPVITLTVFEIALVVRAFALDSLLVESGFTGEPNFTYRFVASHTSMLLGWVLAAYFVSLSRDFTRHNSALATTRDQLVELRRDASARLATRRAELIEQIRHEISTRLELGNRTSPLKPQTLKQILDDVVRPISHDLADGRESVEFSSVAPTPRRIQWKGVFLSALMTNPIRPFTFAAWIAWTTSQLFVAVYGQIGWSLSITAITIGLFTLSLAKLGWSHLPESWGLAVRNVLLTLSFATISLLMFLANHLLFGIEMRGTPIVAASALHLIVFGWVIALVTSIGSTLQGITSELEFSTLELRREVVMLNATYRQMTSAIARVLHGPVQDAVSVGLQKVSNANIPEENANQIAGEVAESIRKSLLLMSTPSSSSRNLERSLSNLVELWEGIVVVTIHMDSDIAIATGSDNRVADTIIEIVRESTSNAVRHSAAKHVAVHISRDYSMRAVLVVVTNDGAPLDQNATSGLGTRNLDELTLGWSRQQVGTDVETRALVPLAS